MTDHPEPPRSVSGAVMVLRLYDIAYAIDLARVEALAAASDAASDRKTLTRAKPKAMAFDVPPVELALGETTLELAGGPQTAHARARVYDFGAVAIDVRLSLDGLAWDEYVDRVAAVEAATADSAVHASLLRRLTELIGPALDRPTDAGPVEDYVLSIVRRLEPPMDADTFLEAVDLVPLFTGERAALAEGARRELLRNRFSYYRDDLAVLTWDHAFLLEPAGDTDVAELLEVANAQLLELRYYDELLDRELPAMYARVAAARRVLPSLARRRYANLARRLYTRVAEVTEITQRVENALRVTEDTYLARIYAAAVDQFRIPAYTAAVDRKLEIVRDTYTALYEEASTGRAEILEAAIVLLIVLEIVLAFLL